MAPPRRGWIFYVNDQQLTLPPDSDRQLHDERRPFLIVSGDHTNSDAAWPVVSGCPISSSTTYRTEFDVKLNAGDGNLSKKGWVRIHAVQPILKADLGDATGSLLPAQMEIVDARILQMLGLLPNP